MIDASNGPSLVTEPRYSVPMLVRHATSGPVAPRRAVREAMAAGLAEPHRLAILALAAPLVVVDALLEPFLAGQSGSARGWTPWTSALATFGVLTATALLAYWVSTLFTWLVTRAFAMRTSLGQIRSAWAYSYLLTALPSVVVSSAIFVSAKLWMADPKAGAGALQTAGSGVGLVLFGFAVVCFAEVVEVNLGFSFMLQFFAGLLALGAGLLVFWAATPILS